MWLELTITGFRIHLPAGTDSERGSTDAALEARLQKANLAFDVPEDSAWDVRTRFFLACLRCLQLVQEALYRLSTDPQLGATDQRSIDTLLQIVIYLGLYPSFEANVGLPLSTRTRFPSLKNFEGLPNSMLRVLLRSILYHCQPNRVFLIIFLFSIS